MLIWMHIQIHIPTFHKLLNYRTTGRGCIGLVALTMGMCPLFLQHSKPCEQFYSLLQKDIKTTKGKHISQEWTFFCAYFAPRILLRHN